MLHWDLRLQLKVWWEIRNVMKAKERFKLSLTEFFAAVIVYMSPLWDHKVLLFYPFCLCRYVIECPNCAVIYRSRQYWYGNQDPVETVVRTEIQHVWPGVRTQNSPMR